MKKEKELKIYDSVLIALKIKKTPYDNMVF